MQVPVESPASRARWRWPVAIFVAITVLGVFYAKWDPYYFKAFSAAAHHTLGKSIVTGASAKAPAVGFQAALSYTVAYFKDIWIALLVGLLVGAGVQTLLPAGWLYRVLGRVSPKSRALALAAAVPSMMCTCCSAPIAVSMKKSRLSTGATLAYWLGNPVLNPATIIFMGFVLGWNWALLRIVMGLALVIGASWLGDRWMTKDEAANAASLQDLPTPVETPPTLGRYFSTLGRLVIGLIPEYIVIVAALGAARAWLFPAMNPAIGHSLWLMLVLAIFGTLFVIPTAGEIPIIQTLMSYGLGLGAGGTLMLTLPAISLPSMAMVGQQLGAKTMTKVALLVAVAGLLTGLLALWLL
ncbi:MAG: permease [Firmicutes bacterium]|nr:permease [Bacillota bacterium]